MKKSKIAQIILGLCFCILWSGGIVNAMTSAEYLKALQPPGNTRGLGGTTPSPPEQLLPEVALRLLFNLNSAGLTYSAVNELQGLAAALEDESVRLFKFEIEGHTCDLGTAEYNLELSRRRAYAVAEWLINNTSFSPEQFEVSGSGESCPLVANTDENARRKNRRVLLKNTMKKVVGITGVPLQGSQAALQIIRYTDGQEEIMTDGDTLKSGDQYSVAFKSASKPYAYVCQMDSSGTIAILFPSPAYSQQINPITLDSIYQIPEITERFFLDTTTGVEQVLLVANDIPVENPLLACQTVFQSNGANQRGIGGIKPSPSIAPAAGKAEVTSQLCEIMLGGRTRGIGGIKQVEQSSSLPFKDVVPQGSSCSGFFLKRSFIHE